ncbi:MAG: sporulation protein [Firmicutes bacterium]|nr:sporulation protein [Bacillota bacterium]
MRKRLRRAVALLALALIWPVLPAAAAADSPSDAQQAAALINQARQQKGLEPLTVDPTLTRLALLKAQDMARYGYFGHQSPTYGSPWEMLRNAGVSFTYAGETLAKGPSASSVTRVVLAYGQNTLLSGRYGNVGIAAVPAFGTKIWVFLYTGTAQGNQPASTAPAAPPSAPPATGPPAGTPAQLTQDEARMLTLVNQARARSGLAPLTADPELVRLARLKARDMIARGYFGHQSPTYGSPFDMLRAAGVSYRYAGENLAGAPDVESAHANLMASPGHRANILNPNYTRVGIGVVDGGPYGKIFVQLFVG